MRQFSSGVGVWAVGEYRFDVAGRPVVVVGGGPRAVAEAAALVDAGAHVTVVAPEVTDALADLAEREIVTWLGRDTADGIPADLVVRVSENESESEPEPAADTPGNSSVGTVTLVGAGPGDPGLLTVAGRDALLAADVVVADRLVPHEALRDLDPATRVVDVAKIPGGRSTSQERINELLVEHARAGRTVVRLKGGDPFVFGRGGEELIACAEAGIPTRVVPGVTSSVAGPSLAGIPVTHRGLAQGFSVISGHVPPGHPDSTIDYTALARSGTTIVVLMGVRTLGAIAAALVDGGLAPDTPAAVVADAGLPSQRAVRGPLSSIAALAEDEGLRPPAVGIVGPVVETMDKST